MNYFENFKNERFHDNNLLELLNYITSKDKYDVIKKFMLINLDDIGEYQTGYRKKDYDVHLEFKHAVICVETKVDSSENAYDENPYYQTQRIHRNYVKKYKKATFFRYITYGASEFYIKKMRREFFQQDRIHNILSKFLYRISWE